MDNDLKKAPKLSRVLQEAIKILESGGIIGIPTETVYGLAACINQPLAIHKVFELKNRPKDHPLIVHIGDFQDLKKYTRDVPSYVDVLIHKFWPGPLTFILKKTDEISDLITAGQDSVAVRMPNHPVTLELLKNLDAPLVAPSANKFMQVSPTSPGHVHEGLGEDLFVLDGGECVVGIESTIIDARNPDEIIILRPGMINLDDLEGALKDLKIKIRYLEKPEGDLSEKNQGKDISGNSLQAVKTPGSCKKHYSPSKKLYLLKSKKLLAELLIQLAKEHGPDVGMYFLSFGFSEELFDLYQAMDNYFVTHDMPTTPGQYAQELYGALHEADESHSTVIIVESPPRTKEWVAILDRLAKAAG